MKQKYWGEEHPNKWLLLADRLTQPGTTHPVQSLIDLDKVIEIGTHLGVTNEEVAVFLKYYHSLGDLIYFDEEGLRDTVVLSPQWLVNMFRLVTSATHVLSKMIESRDQTHFTPFLITTEKNIISDLH